MEIKFNKYIPKWAINIVQRNNFVREKMSKFVSGVEKLDIINKFYQQNKIFNIIDQMSVLYIKFSIIQKIDF